MSYLGIKNIRELSDLKMNLQMKVGELSELVTLSPTKNGTPPDLLIIGDSLLREGWSRDSVMFVTGLSQKDCCRFLQVAIHHFSKDLWTTVGDQPCTADTTWRGLEETIHRVRTEQEEHARKPVDDHSNSDD